MLKKKEIAVFCIFFVVVAALYVVSSIKVQEFREQLNPTQMVSAFLVRPEVLEIAGGEFRGILADYLLLKASVYLGGRYSTQEGNKKVVSTLFRQSAALDPRFFQTCYYTQGYLPWWHMVEEGIEILDICKENRVWDWQPCFYIGFDYFYFLKDNLTASRYLMEASKISNGDTFLGFLGTRLSQQGGQTKASIAFLKAMHQRTENEKAKEEIEQRIAALEGILTLEKAVAQFQSMFFGHPPDTLEQLVEAGILERLPENPWRSDGTYVYENGKIDF